MATEQKSGLSSLTREPYESGHKILSVDGATTVAERPKIYRNAKREQRILDTKGGIREAEVMIVVTPARMVGETGGQHVENAEKR